MEIYFREPNKLKTCLNYSEDVSLPLLNNNDEVVANIYIPVNGKSLSLNLAGIQHSKLDSDIYAIDVKLIKDSRATHNGYGFLLVKSYTTESVEKGTRNVVHVNGRIRRIKIDISSTKVVLDCCAHHAADLYDILTHVWVYGQTNPRCAIRDLEDHIVGILRSMEVSGSELYCIIDTAPNCTDIEIEVHPVFRLSKNNYSVIKLQAIYK